MFVCCFFFFGLFFISSLYESNVMFGYVILELNSFFMRPWSQINFDISNHHDYVCIITNVLEIIINNNVDSITSATPAASPSSLSLSLTPIGSSMPLFSRPSHHYNHHNHRHAYSRPHQSSPVWNTRCRLLMPWR